MGWVIPRPTLTRGLVFVALLGVVALGGVARAGELEDKLAALAAAPPGEPRIAAATAVIDLAKGAVTPQQLIDRLHAPRASTDAQRRALLGAIGAEVPNAAGSFTYPGRPKNPNAAELDWLAALAKQPATPSNPALADALEVVALLRALADTRTEPAADAILDYGFTPDGLVYRDECGRQLRRMSPSSVPTLLRASQDKKRDAGSFARYSNYQLDRLSLNRPAYALAAAPDDRLEIAMLKAIRDVRHPDAVTAVLDRVDSPSNGVRRAAREAWMAYVSGPPPPPAPTAFRKLPGGKKSDKPMPLYLTYRELADQELRRVLLAQLGKEPDAKLNAEQMTRILLEIYDRKRAEGSDEEVQKTVALAAEGKWEEVGKLYDAILMKQPLYARRSQLAPGYLELARTLARKEDWDGAVIAYHKAIALDPDGPKSKEARGELAGAQARREAKGVMPPPKAVTPPSPGAPAAPSPSPTAVAPVRRGWLLYAGVAGAGIGGLLLVLGFLRRKRAPQAA